MQSKVNITVKLAKQLREKLDPLIPESLSNSTLIIDLADTHEVCRTYLEDIEKILASNNPEEIENILYKIDCELFEHLAYHLKSLKKLLPKLIHSLQARETKRNKAALKARS